VLIQLFPPDDERLSLEACRGGKINTLKKEKSASSWLKIHNCLRMHGQQNIKFQDTAFDLILNSFTLTKELK
jgi:hypothetical protein